MKSGLGSTRTRRLEVRPYILSDYERWVEGCRNRLPKQNDYDRGPPPASKLTRATFKKWLKSKDELRKRDLQYAYGIFDRKTGAHLGTIDFLVNSRLAVQTANFGYQIHNQYWKRGFAKEATKAALSIAFKQLKLHKLEAGIERSNQASIAVARSLRMRKEGTRTSYYFNGDRWIDLDFYILTSEMIGIRNKPTVRTNIGTYWLNKDLK